MDQAVIPASALDRFQLPALIAGVVGLLATLAAIFTDGLETFTQFYLYAYMFWLAFSLGGLLLAMIQNVVGGRWGLATRRIFEAMALGVLVNAILFIPIIVAAASGQVYEWSNADIVANDPILQWKAPYLNVPFFIGRAVFYFICWYALAYFLNKWSLEQERSGSEAATLKMRRLSAGGIILYAFTLNFAATDWVMSLEPHWFSTMYGVIYAVGHVTVGMAFAALLLTRLVQNKTITSPLLSADHFHDMGKLLFAFVILWTYTSFSQFVIIWSGNLAEFAQYYYYRLEGGWEIFPWILIPVNFLFPFFFLLGRPTKRNLRPLAFIAIYLIVVRLIDLYWTVIPAIQYGEGDEAHHFVFHWSAITALIGIGGFWLWFFARNLKNRPLLILRDPRMIELYGERAGKLPAGQRI